MGGFAEGLLGALQGYGQGIKQYADQDIADQRTKEAEQRQMARQKEIMDMQEQLNIAREDRQNARQDFIRDDDWNNRGGKAKLDNDLETGKANRDHMKATEDISRRQLALSAAAHARAGQADAERRNDPLLALQKAQQQQAAGIFVGEDGKYRQASNESRQRVTGLLETLKSLPDNVRGAVISNPNAFAGNPVFKFFAPVLQDQDAMAMVRAQASMGGLNKKPVGENDLLSSYIQNGLASGKNPQELYADLMQIKNTKYELGAIPNKPGK